MDRDTAKLLPPSPDCSASKSGSVGQSRPRIILYFKFINFFAELERRRSGNLGAPPQGTPLVVIKPTASTPGNVVSASEAARELGIADGITFRQAQRLAPNACFVTADYPFYKERFFQAMDRLAGFSPLL